MLRMLGPPSVPMTGMMLLMLTPPLLLLLLQIYAKLGRPIPTTKLYVQPDDTTLSEVAHAEYAWDNDDDVPPNLEDEVSEALDPGTMAQIQRIVARMP